MHLSGGGVVAFMLMVAFWDLIIWAVVALFRGRGGTWTRAPSVPILAERFAAGEIDEDEYRGGWRCCALPAVAPGSDSPESGTAGSDTVQATDSWWQTVTALADVSHLAAARALQRGLWPGPGAGRSGPTAW